MISPLYMFNVSIIIIHFVLLLTQASLSEASARCSDRCVATDEELKDAIQDIIENSIPPHGEVLLCNSTKENPLLLNTMHDFETNLNLVIGCCAAEHDDGIQFFREPRAVIPTCKLMLNNPTSGFRITEEAENVTLTFANIQVTQSQSVDDMNVSFLETRSDAMTSFYNMSFKGLFSSTVIGLIVYIKAINPPSGRSRVFASFWSKFMDNIVSAADREPAVFKFIRQAGTTEEQLQESQSTYTKILFYASSFDNNFGGNVQTFGNSNIYSSITYHIVVKFSKIT